MNDGDVSFDIRWNSQTTMVVSILVEMKNVLDKGEETVFNTVSDIILVNISTPVDNAIQDYTRELGE